MAKNENTENGFAMVDKTNTSHFFLSYKKQSKTIPDLMSKGEQTTERTNEKRAFQVKGFASLCDLYVKYLYTQRTHSHTLHVSVYK